MDDEWDLDAVVRGCTATVTTTTTTSTTSNNPFPSSSPLPLHNDENLYDFPGLMDERINPFQGLQEIYREFCVEQSPPTAAAAVDITGTSTISIAVGQDFQSHQLTQPPQEILQMPVPQHQMNMPRTEENMQFKNPVFGSSSLTFPAGNSQPIRPRRRKNQQLKMVREMTQEELSADSWAWRKYGQKPIKGSPYPRNYYRCSTSKGCAARKQVERSPNDPSIFVVSYTGEHTHPRPTHRSSLAGSTRNKLSQATAGTKQNTAAPLFPKGSLSSSSPASGSCFSPSTPLTEGETAVDMEVMGEDEGGGGDGDDDNNTMIIPTDHLMNDDEDIFKGFQDSDRSSGGGDFFSSGLVPSPPWTPTSSTVTTATFNSVGGS